jgi:hypothetical protein
LEKNAGGFGLVERYGEGSEIEPLALGLTVQTGSR